MEQFWIVEFPKQIDGYRLSNYFQKDRNGRVKPAPIWDWNLSFGNANYLDGGHTNGWYYNQLAAVDHIWARRLITGSQSGSGIGDPDFNQKIADRWAVLRTDVMNGPRLLGRIDQLAEMLSEAAARDFARFPRLGQYIWPNPDGGFNGDPAPTRAWDVDYQSPNSYAGIIAQMKKWVMGRYLWVDSQFARSPVISLVDGMVTNGTTVTLSSPDGGTIYYTLNGVDPRAPGGTVTPVAQVYSGPITVNANVRIVARVQRAGTFQNTWSAPSASSLFTSLPGLRITEIMYHPAPPPLGSTNSVGDFEFIEVKNVSGMSLNLAGYRLTGGVEFTFPATVLGAGQSGVVVNNIAAFQSRYGTGINILGTFTGNLSDDGEQLALQGALYEPIQDITFRDSWNRVTDGLGFSLVVANENAPLSSYGSATNWRVSSVRGGSPGAIDGAVPVIPGVVINEIMARPSAGSFDTVELLNPTASAVDIGGWFLSDDFLTPRKYVFPAGTVVPANGFITLNETAFNTGLTPFALGAKSDEIYLYAADGTNVLAYVHGFAFDESPVAGTYGRHVISTGAEQFVIQSNNTLNAANSGPAIGPVVISEIMYHPPDAVIGTNGFNNTEEEFIELLNISSSPVPLYDPNFPTNQWRLRGGVDFDFPPNVVLPAGGYAVVVTFDPVAYPAALSAFRARYGVSPTTPVFGPWDGDLNNDGDTIRLRRPDAPDSVTAEVIYLNADVVEFSDHTPWPANADGLALSLQRRPVASYGNDPTNWTAAAPNPGSAYVGGTVPVITSQPGSQLIVSSSNVTFTATATGSAPLNYQWRYMGVNLPGATNSNLVLTNFQVSQAGVYNILVFNGAGAALGQDFVITSRVALQIVQQPLDRTVVVGRTTNFNVSALGTGPLRYQWRFNGVPITDATNALLTLSSIQFTNAGGYSVQVSDDYASIVSPVATLNVVSIPVITLDPVSVSVVEGGSASFSVAASGTQPISFRWRRGGFTFTGGIISSTPSNSILTLTNITAAAYAAPNNRFDVALTNIAGQATRLTTAAFITVLTDADGDGLPDAYEAGRSGFDTNNPADGMRDDDGDGMKNRDEFIAGTDVLDSNSVLRVTGSIVGRTLQFLAMSNHVYSVEYTDKLPAVWQKLTDILAAPGTNRIITVSDPVMATNRFYRVVTPPYR